MNFSVDKNKVMLSGKSDSTCKSLGSERALKQGKGCEHPFLFLFLEFDGLLLSSDFCRYVTIFNGDIKISLSFLFYKLITSSVYLLS